MKINDLEDMWEGFFEIRLDINDSLQNDFYHWQKGTSRITILKWFNTHLVDGILFQKFSVEQLELLWDEFSNIPINLEDEIELDFYCWKKGTYRFEIWHWFDEKLPNGIAEWTAA